MGVDDRQEALKLEAYISAHIDPEPKELSGLTREANLRLVNPRMISGHLQGRLLKMLVRLHRPRRILELGTYSGYATACMAEALPPDGSITTIELFDELKPFITKAMKSMELQDRVECLIGDAIEIIPTLPLSEYDLVYIDANKRHYEEYLNLLEERLPVGALIIADNTLWDGKVTDLSAQDAQTCGIRAFNDRIATSERFEKVILPIRDGLSLIYKIK